MYTKNILKRKKKPGVKPRECNHSSINVVLSTHGAQAALRMGFIHVWSLQKHNPATELWRPGDSAGRVMVIYTGHLAVRRLSHSLHSGPRLAAQRQALHINTFDTLLLLSH